MSLYLSDYFEQAAARQNQGIEPLPLNAPQVKELTAVLLNPPSGSEETLLNLLTQRINPGVDDSSRLKADFLSRIAKGELSSPIISKKSAVKYLGGMKGGFNVSYLIDFLSDKELCDTAVEALSDTLLIYDAFDRVSALCKKGNQAAQTLMRRWAEGSWFLESPKLLQSITLTVFKVSGEINTDDFSPAPDAWSRPDIPLHAQAMFKMERPGITPDVSGVKGPVKAINALKEKGYPLLFVGDVVGTGSSRKSAANSLIWHIGHDIDGVPNKRAGGFVVGGKIAPIFYTTLEDSGALPVECDVSRLENGMTVDFNVYAGTITDHDSGEVLCTFKLKTPTLLDEVRAGGRIRLIIGKDLTARARAFLGLGEDNIFSRSSPVEGQGGFTRAQKIVGKACGVYGIRPGQY